VFFGALFSKKMAWGGCLVSSTVWQIASVGCVFRITRSGRDGLPDLGGHVCEKRAEAVVWHGDETCVSTDVGRVQNKVEAG